MHPSIREPHHALTSGLHVFALLLAALLAMSLATACGPASDPGGETADGGAESTGGATAGEETPEGASDSDTFATLTELERFAPPADPGAMAPQLSPAREGGVWMSWLEPIGFEAGGDPEIGAPEIEGDSEAGGNPGHRLRVARFDGTAWGPAWTVAQGSDFFANWADVPSVVEGEGGELLAHWLAKIGDDTYAYGVFLARSSDGGETWSELGTLHDDASPTEHGFVSILAAPGGGFDAAWLDGRGMADGGPMTVRAAHVAPRASGDDGGGRDGIEALGVLDERVCECCQTGAAQTPDGPLVAYRDRSQDEVRDVYTVRRSGDGWSAPAAVADDGWTIAGCPVNGPAVAAAGERAFLAWFTAADGQPRVRAAFSEDAGASFATAVDVDAEAAAPGRPAPLGRVDAVLVNGAANHDGPAVVSWLGGDGGVWLRRVSPGQSPADPGSAGGTLHPARRVARTATARASGFPRIETLVEPDAGREANPRLAVAWVEPGDGNDGQASEGGIRFATVPLTALPLTALPATTPPTSPTEAR